jgi:hypothetical protein
MKIIITQHFENRASLFVDGQFRGTASSNPFGKTNYFNSTHEYLGHTQEFGNNHQVFDEANHYKGFYRLNENGGINKYNEIGQYSGKIDPSPNGMIEYNTINQATTTHYGASPEDVLTHDIFNFLSDTN